MILVSRDGWCSSRIATALLRVEVGYQSDVHVALYCWAIWTKNRLPFLPRAELLEQGLGAESDDMSILVWIAEINRRW